MGKWRGKEVRGIAPGSYRASVNTDRLYNTLYNGLASKTWCKESNVLSLRTLVADKQLMKPGQWLGLVPCVRLSALTLMVR